MKKLISLLLAFAMVFSLAMPAMAADVTGNTTGDVSASYTPVIAISDVVLSGDAVSVDTENQTYTVTIPEGAELVEFNVTITGTNLDKIAADNENYQVSYHTNSYFVIEPSMAAAGGESAIREYLSVDPSEVGTHNLKYSNDGGTNWTDTGWDVVIQQAGAEPDAPTLPNPLYIATDLTDPMIGFKDENKIGVGSPIPLTQVSDGIWSFTETVPDGAYYFSVYSVSEGYVEYPPEEIANAGTNNQYNPADDTWSVYGTGGDNTVTIPDPLYFKAEGATTVGVFAYKGNGIITDADGNSIFAMTAVEGEVGIFSIAADTLPVGTTQVAFSSDVSDTTDTLDLPTDGSDMYDYDNSKWTTYVPGSTEPAVITGVSLSGTGVSYDEATKTYTVAHDATGITLTVTGTNLQNGTEDNYIFYAAGYATPVTSSHFDIADDGTSATLSGISVSYFSDSSNWEIIYYNNYTDADNRTEVPAGIYVTYDDGTTPTYSINIDANITGGTVTAKVGDTVVTEAAEGDTVTLTATPAEGYALHSFTVYDGNFDPVTVSSENTFVMPASDVTVNGRFLLPGTDLTKIYFKNTNGWDEIYATFYDSEGFILPDGVATLTIVEPGIYATPDDFTIPEWASQVYFSNKQDGLTVFTDIPTDSDDMFVIGTETDDDGKYTGTWEKYTASTPSNPISADITWGSMAFTYTDGENGAEGAWSNDGSEKVGTVTVTNTGDTTFTAVPSYTAETGYTEIEGKFYDDAETETYELGVTLQSEASHTFLLKLFNQPSKAISAGTKIGTVTIVINQGSPA